MKKLLKIAGIAILLYFFWDLDLTELSEFWAEFGVPLIILAVLSIPAVVLILGLLADLGIIGR